MKIVLTGASSFTGVWFARELSAAGHQVIAPLRGRAESAYTGLRLARVKMLANSATIHWDSPFGSEPFIGLLGSGVDLLCHHAAHMDNYRSPDFDVERALAENTRNLRRVLEAGKRNGLRGVFATGTVFEANEGVGEAPLRAFSLYGLSKALTFQTMTYFAQEAGLPIGKFVIANPFGPFEEPRFCAHLLTCWSKGERASVKTPYYLRDNIHVSLLARAYAQTVNRFGASPSTFHFGPTGYTEAQGAFAERMARELSPRLGLECGLDLEHQTVFAEPRIRLNTDVLDSVAWTALGWDETKAWDDLADYYRRTYLNAKS